MFRWLFGKGASARSVQRVLTDVGAHEWRAAMAQLPFLIGLSGGQQQELARKAAWLLASKTFHGAQGLAVTQEMALSIALQAALPVLNLDVRLYEGWTQIILYPGGFLIPRQEVEDSGVVHDYVEEASGESWDGGPVVLSWEDVAAAAQGSINVVIHEFAHKLDIDAGGVDGMPNLYGSGVDARDWQRVLQQAFDDFGGWLNRIEDSIPRDVDPESEQAAPWYEQLPLDPYAAADEAEFFAVSSEAFFVEPGPLAQCYPAWYDLLSRYYRQDPLARLNAS
jgi:Mlc titration factor MtfA (ptsG expression regulator)